MNQTIARFAVPVLLVATAVGIAANRLGASFRPAPVVTALPSIVVALDPTPSERVAIFAGGCFWGIEGVFEHMKGVKSAESGYAGGATANPSYEAVSSGSTGHAEAVRVVYDPSQVSYGQLLQVFFSVAHDPTQLNRQGPDFGTQYRSAIYYVNDEQKQAIQGYVSDLTRSKTFRKPIVTEIAPLDTFHVAEPYHQDYMARHPNQPYIVMHDAPKVKNLRKQFPTLYRDTK